MYNNSFLSISYIRYLFYRLPLLTPLSFLYFLGPKLLTLILDFNFLNLNLILTLPHDFVNLSLKFLNLFLH